MHIYDFDRVNDFDFNDEQNTNRKYYNDKIGKCKEELIYEKNEEERCKTSMINRVGMIITNMPIDLEHINQHEITSNFKKSSTSSTVVSIDHIKFDLYAGNKIKVMGAKTPYEQLMYSLYMIIRVSMIKKGSIVIRNRSNAHIHRMGDMFETYYPYENLRICDIDTPNITVKHYYKNIRIPINETSRCMHVNYNLLIHPSPYKRDHSYVLDKYNMYRFNSNIQLNPTLIMHVGCDTMKQCETDEKLFYDKIINSCMFSQMADMFDYRLNIYKRMYNDGDIPLRMNFKDIENVEETLNCMRNEKNKQKKRDTSLKYTILDPIYKQSSGLKSFLTNRVSSSREKVSQYYSLGDFRNRDIKDLNEPIKNVDERMKRVFRQNISASEFYHFRMKQFYQIKSNEKSNNDTNLLLKSEPTIPNYVSVKYNNSKSNTIKCKSINKQRKTRHGKKIQRNEHKSQTKSEIKPKDENNNNVNLIINQNHMNMYLNILIIVSLQPKMQLSFLLDKNIKRSTKKAILKWFLMNVHNK